MKTAIVDKAAGRETFWVGNVHKIQKDKLIWFETAAEFTDFQSWQRAT